MSRRIAAMLILAVGFIGVSVLAEDRDKAPSKSQYMYIIATRSTEGPAILMQVGDQTFVASKLIMKKELANYEIIAKDENVVVRRETKDGFKDLTSNKEIMLPITFLARASGNLRDDSRQPKDHGSGSGDFLQ